MNPNVNLSEIDASLTEAPIGAASLAEGTSATPTRLGAILERIPMTVFWALAGQGILSVARLLTSMTVGGRFGVGSEEQLGYYSTAFGILLTLVGLHEAFVTTPLTVFTPSCDQERKKKFAGSMMMTSFLLVGFLFSGVIALVLLRPALGSIQPTLLAAVIAMAAFAPLQLLREFSRRWLLAGMQVRPSALFEFLFAVIYLSTLATLVRLAWIDAVSIFAAIGCVNAACLAIFWWIYRGEFEFSKTDFRAQLKENGRYGRWVAGENVSSTIMMYFCNGFLLFMIDEASAGVFFACFTIVLLANPFLLGICSILAPRAASEYTSGGWPALVRTLIKYGSFVTSVLAVFAAVTWFYGSELTTLFFGPRYASFFEAHFDGVNRVTSLLGLAMPLLSISFVLTTGLLAANRPHDSFYAAVFGLLVMVVANFSFTNPTLETAAISFLLSIFSTMLFRLVCLVRAAKLG